MKKIEKLTPEQKARFSEFVEKWKKMGLSTDPADRPLAENAIKKCYRFAGLKEPKQIVWCDSPLSMCFTHQVFNQLNEAEDTVWNSVRDSVGNSVRDSVRNSVRHSVRDSVWNSLEFSVWRSVKDSVLGSVRDSAKDSVRNSAEDSVKGSVRNIVWNSVLESVWNSVGASVRDSVRGSVGHSVEKSVGDSVAFNVRNSVRDSVRDSVLESVRDSVWKSVDASGYGQHDASWLAFFDYFREVCDLKEETEQVQGLAQGCMSHGWWIPCKEVCFVSERHNVCKLNKDEVIHCEDGPAIAYPDGFEVYAWNGVRIPKEWITDKNKLKASDILKHANIDQRSVGCQIIGWNKILKELNAKEIDKDEDEKIGTLLECEIPEVGKRNFLQVLDPNTGEYVALSVPSHCKTALEANAWTWNIEPELYKPETQT